MVRETRHLWVGNLPDNIREDRIREHFKRYGRVQNVKLLGRTDNVNTGVGGGGASGVCATVAFMDIKSASKAHNAEHVLDERTLSTEYYEPAAIPSSAGAPSAGSSPAGSGYSGSSSSVNSAPAPASVSRYHLSGGEDNTSTTCPLAASAAAPATWRGTNDSATEYCRRGNTPAAYGRYQRNNSSAPYCTPPSNVERTTPHHRWYGSGERGAGATGGESTPSTPGGGTEGGRRRRHSGSGSSRSDSSSPEPSDTSRASTPATQPLAHHNNHRTPPALQHQWASTASGRPLAICVRNLPTRSTDSSLKDGLYHEYKKHGKVVWVKVVGQNADRYAVVRFKKPSDVEKALEVSQDKLFFGCKISVAPHQSCDEDADSAKPYETDIDEYHPKATRTLFIGNLEKDVTQQQLRDKFKHFGRIIEIDIKKGSSGGAGYAFCQYASISSVVEAIRAMDGEYVGGSRVKLGFGKPVATTCVWVDGLTEHTEKQVLTAVSRCGGATSVCVDRAAGAALVHFEQAAAAGSAVRELRRVAAAVSAAEPDHPRLCVDYASRECQEAFYEQLEKHGGSAALTGTERLSGDLASRYLPSTRHDTIRYEGCGSRSRGSSYGRGASRTPRYAALEHYDPAEYAADRRYRVYADDSASPATVTPDDAPYEERLQSVVVSPHRSRNARRDSSVDGTARNHSKERHRSGVRRSRSGSRGTTERHGARRRHRRRRDGSGSLSRADTPLRDELDAPPAEPRRAPRERPPLPMSLPLPKFAMQLLRAAPATPRPAPAPAPDSPPRPPSVSSSSGGSAPHSPSLEERIRSLDEKLNGSRALNEVPDRTRLRHRLLEIDINEVKPSEVVRSLLAKRSVFDEDSERLEGAGRAPSPQGSPRGRASTVTPRALRYPFPAHPPPQPPLPPDSDIDSGERQADPRLLRPRSDACFRPRTPSTERCTPPITEQDTDTTDSNIRCRADFSTGPEDNLNESLSFESRNNSQTDRNELSISRDLERHESTSSNGSRIEFSDCVADKLVTINNALPKDTTFVETDSADRFHSFQSVERNAREVMDMLLKQVEIQEIQNIEEIEHQFKCQDYSNISGFHKQNDSKIILNSINHLHTIENQCKKEIVDDQTVDTEKSLHKIGDICSKDLPMKPMNDKKTKETIEECIKKELDAYSQDCQKSNEIELIENHVINVIDSYSMDDCIKKELNLYTIDSKKSEDNIEDHVSKEINSCALYQKTKHTIEDDKQQTHLNTMNSLKLGKDNKTIDREPIRTTEKFIKDRHSHNIYSTKLEKENIQFDKTYEKDSNISNHSIEIKNTENERHLESERKNDRDKTRHCKEKIEKDKHDSEKLKNKVEKISEKKSKEDVMSEKPRTEKSDKLKVEKDIDKIHQKEKNEKDGDKLKHPDEKSNRYEHHRKERTEKRKDSLEIDTASGKSKKDDKHKHERSKKEYESKRDSKKDSDNTKHRKSSRDESAKELNRKDSTDSSTSRASHESLKVKETENIEVKEDIKLKHKTQLCIKQENDKDLSLKTEIKEEKDLVIIPKIKTEPVVAEQSTKGKTDIEKQRHYSLDSCSLESKRKERLSSCSSLPPTIGHKRRISSQDSLDSYNDDGKKIRNESKIPERRESKDSRTESRHKTTKFSKGHFAKIIESKTKDDKKNQVKPPDDSINDYKEIDTKDQKTTDKTKCIKHSPKPDSDEKCNAEVTSEGGLHNHLDFLATLELRSSEEDERQKALRKEMKEKKRIQQLQQIQELQMQHDALQHGDGKLKDDKKPKFEKDEKKKEAARDKRMSTDRKSKDEKMDNSKRKTRRPLQTSDSSDSDEPKKHSIFDIIDDCPTYISMYDKVKARSCKNMQKQEEEKRQEKIKAKFSQLKQSRAKREEKKRSSWDEDSDTDNERRKAQKSSLDNSSDEDKRTINRKHEQSHEIDSDNEEYFGIASNENDLRNKLSRKNSRTRIMSDTSDDETFDRSKSPKFHDIKKENISDSESLERIRNDDILKNCNVIHDSIKKNSLLNLFGKSDSDDSKIKLNFDNGYKSNYLKSLSHDFSSESESTPNRGSVEIRKKHRKKQKKHKAVYSDDESKIDNSDTSLLESEQRHRNLDKQRRHSSKKDKRKEKLRESIDVDDIRDEKTKVRKERKINSTNSFESVTEINPILKKDGKMEDIFGPLSDDSDKDTKHTNHKSDYSSLETDYCANNIDYKLKEREDSKRKRDRRRKEKLLKYFKDDDNSLDVDAVSKAIEARLFADAMDNPNKVETRVDNKINHNDLKFTDDETVNEINKHERLKKDCKEKKKKKKRNKEDRHNRREHHHFHHQEKLSSIDYTVLDDGGSSSPKTMLLNIPLPSDIQTNKIEKTVEGADYLQSHSLPRLTDSPPIPIPPNDIIDGKIIDCVDVCDDKMQYIPNKEIEIEEIPMPPPFVPDISEVPLPKDPLPSKLIQHKESFMAAYCQSDDICDEAVRNMTNSEKDVQKVSENLLDSADIASTKIEKKVADEKPRASISQEETEDAVAALLGESFGGKVNNAFANCFEEDDNKSIHPNENENAAVENENIPEEDAEEMRQAVQNLNACEMEMKPDTPVSDNDLLLIDTDTEEADETPQDAIDKLPINIIATNPALNNVVEKNKTGDVSNTSTTEIKPNITPSIVLPERRHSVSKENQTDIKIHLAKRENAPIMTSTATPVITSWTLTNNKLLEPHVLNIQSNQLSARDKGDFKPTHITANIMQLKSPQNMQINNTIRPIVAPNRVTAPYQVINQMIRTQPPNMQPPTIKIPEPHVLYQKQQGIVISPRTSSDPRMQSPKVSPQGEGMTSPRLSLSSVGMASPNALQQRSPGQVTVVRMQQPPLSPIQAIHMPHGARTMLSPNRPNSVLVQTQGAPIHFSRLPVTPVLTPISKQMNTNSIVQQNKTVGVTTAPMMHQQKLISSDPRRNENKKVSENKNESTKLILSPTSIHTTSAAVMTQNRMINMTNTMHVGNMSSSIHKGNKVIINTVGQINDNRDNQGLKSDQMNHIPYVSTSIIHVGGTNTTSSAAVIQSGVKTVTSNLQETIPVSRSQGSNVIHNIHPKRLLTQAPNNLINVDVNKGPSVLSMAAIRPPSVLTKLELSNMPQQPATTTSTISLPPLLLKTTTSNPSGLLRINTKVEKDNMDSPVVLQNHLKKDTLVKSEEPVCGENTRRQNDVKPSTSPLVAKCETDFEELLKDTTNEIKVTNDPEKKLEVNVGKTVTLFTTSQSRDKELSTENTEKDLLKPAQPVKLPQLSDFNEEKVKIESEDIDSFDKNSKLKRTENICHVKPFTDHKAYDKVKPKDEETAILENNAKTADSAFFSFLPNQTDTNDSHLKNDENDSWSGKDVNIESVIKKVDSLCNDTIDTVPKNEPKVNDAAVPSKLETKLAENNLENSKPIDNSINMQIEKSISNPVLNSLNMQIEKSISNPVDNPKIQNLNDRISTISKRGGRTVRGKKIGKTQERAQTRQIAKPSRGGTTKRGRGRAKVDKKIKNLVSNPGSAMPGDVYDFHEDSGDEGTSSTNKGESRPRLILTIKSPLSGHANMTPTSTLSITPKDRQKPFEKIKDDKGEDLTSPSPNTRKSRRLQEKDVQRNTVDDVIEDVIKGGGRAGKDCAKKRPTRQVIGKTLITDKTAADTRKSPRGAKRTRDRSISDASADSSDERLVRRDDGIREAKTPRREELNELATADTTPVVPMDTAPVSTSAPPIFAPVATITSAPTPVLTPTPIQATIVTPATAPPPAPVPTPITKPPKKMISEISAKLACAFEAASSCSVQQQAEGETAPPAPREAASPHGQSATGSVGPGIEALRRRGEAGGAALPVGTEAADARVQSPALPHRPPSAPDHHHHRPADRATPLLIRGGEGEGAGVARAFRGYAATASLPRGAHHPPHPLPDHPVAVVGPQPHRHHPGAASRVTLASVPSLSPQGQIAMGDGMYPHFSHQHYQMYQQHFRATQHENRASPSPYTRSLEAEGSEAPTPPLELRRPPSARVPQANELEAHEAFRRRAAPVAVYAVGCGRSPPPAHGTSRLAGALPPHASAAVAGPPHASQVPREADSLQMLLRRYPVMWQGLLALKNDSAAVQMHFVGGNPNVAGDTLTRHAGGAAPLLRIAQRMRLEQPQLDQVHRKMKMENEHCMLLALPCGRDHMDVLQQSTNLTAGFITYLQRKQAAGIVNIAPPGHHQAMYTVHIFPSCEFANENLNRIAPDLMHRVADIAHLLIVIATV